MCAVVNVSAPTLYHHFGSADGLLSAALAEAFEQFLQRKSAATRPSDPEELNSVALLYVTAALEMTEHLSTPGQALIREIRNRVIRDSCTPPSRPTTTRSRPVACPVASPHAPTSRRPWRGRRPSRGTRA